MRIDGVNDLWPAKSRKRAKAAPVDAAAPPQAPPSVTEAEPVPTEDEYLAAVRAELERILDDSRRRPSRSSLDQYSSAEAALEIGRRLYAWRVNSRREELPPDPPLQVQADFGRRHPNWKGLARSTRAVTVELRLEEAVLRRVILPLPFEVPATVSPDDVEQEAAVAVLQALRSYWPWRGTLADWLEISVRNHVRAWMDRQCPLSRWRVRQIKMLTAAIAELEQEFMRLPTDEELEAVLGWTPAIMQRVRQSAHRSEVLSIDHFKALKDQNSGAAFEVIWDDECTARMVRALDLLPDREREIIMLHYVDGLSLNEIARITGRGRGTVIDAHDRALLLLRARVEAPDDAPPPSARDMKRAAAEMMSRLRRGIAEVWRVVATLLPMEKRGLYCSEVARSSGPGGFCQGCSGRRYLQYPG